MLSHYDPFRAKIVSSQFLVFVEFRILSGLKHESVRV